MKKLMLILICCMSLQSIAQDKMTPATKTYRARKGKTIELKDNGSNGVFAEITERESALLFEYTFIASQNDAVTDDEYTETLAFTITPNKSGIFNLKGSDLRKAQAYFYKGCFCMDRGYFAITDGTITGRKLNKTTWYISVNVSYKSKQGDSEQTHHRKLSGKFNIVAQ
jgi:hypothetical protein